MIYLDNQATTPVDPRVFEKLSHYMTHIYGDAEQTEHLFGEDASIAVQSARQDMVGLLHCQDHEIIITSGATESINLAIQGFVHQVESKHYPVTIAVSPLEHKAVLDTVMQLAQEKSVEPVMLQVDSQGRIDLNHLETQCKQKNISLICVMAANHEIGTIYPIDEIAALAEKYEAVLFCDASQGVGKIPILFNPSKISALAFSGHKMYGPKGVGALIVKKGFKLKPMMYGGGQSSGLRGGSLNVPGIVGLGEACRFRILEMYEDELRIREMRDTLQAYLQKHIPELVINGDIQHRLAGTLHISIPGVKNKAVIDRIRNQVAISTGVEIVSGTVQPSHVLRAMGLSKSLIDSALRIGVGKFNTMAEIASAGEIIVSVINEIKSLK